MSLLTDEEINEARAPHIGLPLKCWPQHRAIADASQTVTLKVVAEWGNELCTEHQGGSQLRKQCIFCVEGLFLCASKGEMPGEE